MTESTLKRRMVWVVLALALWALFMAATWDMWPPQAAPAPTVTLTWQEWWAKPLPTFTVVAP